MKKVLRNLVRTGARYLPLLAAALAIAFPDMARAKTTIVSFAFKGVRASSLFESDSPDGCIHRVTQVFLTEARGEDSTSGRFSGPVADVYAGALDSCAAKSLYFEFGEVVLSPDQFTIDHTLASASLKVTVPVKDQVSGTTINLDVDLTWIANTAPETMKLVQTVVFFDGTKELDRSFSTFREATVSGTVSDGTTNFTPDPASGVLQDTKNGTHELTR